MKARCDLCNKEIDGPVTLDIEHLLGKSVRLPVFHAKCYYFNVIKTVAIDKFWNTVKIFKKKKQQS